MEKINKATFKVNSPADGYADYKCDYDKGDADDDGGADDDD